jgi:hypothetical protein
MSSVPLPWWQSMSTIAALSTLESAAATATAMLLK